MAVEKSITAPQRRPALVDIATGPNPFIAEARIGRIEALLWGIYCCANGDQKTGDPGNRDSITYLTLMAGEELGRLEEGLERGSALDLECGQ